MTTVYSLISKQIEIDTSALQIQRAICCLTGLETDCVPAKLLIGNSFTDGARFRAPLSTWIGLDVYKAWTFGIRENGKKRDFCPERNACWYVDATQWEYKINRMRIREIALRGGRPPWALWVTTGYKKHGSIRTPLNHRQFGRVAVDDLIADCSDNAKTLEWWAQITGIQAAGFSRPIIETLDCPVAVIKKNGYQQWQAYAQWARSRYRSPLYQFLCYLLPSKDELKGTKEA